jgi:pimeloyl-ACP methyl ester carboxylesterase
MTTKLQTRRVFLKTGALGAVASAALLRSRSVAAQSFMQAVPKLAQTPVLSIAYEDSGSGQGFPIFLLHGFPDDVRAWDAVVPALVNAGYRAIVPYLRGYGPTRFRDPSAPRMAEQAAIAQDLIDLADALNLGRFAVSGYDWGGRAAAIAAALHPDRVRAAVLIGGDTIQNTISPGPPGDPEAERALWYQWYFNTERGRIALQANRRGICRLLWQTWSPTWHFSDETFNRTAASFDNPDFVDVVIHSYRHRWGNAPGEARFTAVERQLAQHPKIQVPAITLYGAADGVRPPPDASVDRASFTSLIDRQIVAGAGHFLPRERPDVVSQAIVNALRSTH